MKRYVAIQTYYRFA